MSGPLKKISCDITALVKGEATVSQAKICLSLEMDNRSVEVDVPVRGFPKASFNLNQSQAIGSHSNVPERNLDGASLTLNTSELNVIKDMVGALNSF